MSENYATTVISVAIDWTDPTAAAIDGFTVEEIVMMAIDCLIPARCAECSTEQYVPPHTVGEECSQCHAPGSVTSPLVKLGFI